MAIQILNYVIGFNTAEIHKYIIERYVDPRFGANVGDPRYDARVDVNNDGKIDLTDTLTFARDAALTFKTFGITPVMWYHVALPVGVGLIALGTVILLRKR